MATRRLDGTRDLLDGEWARLNSLVVSLRDFFSQQAYLPIDTPVLEATELFLRKSGGELASRLYSFTDLGGHRVSLRPEFTSSVIRAYIQGSVSPPVRWQYAGPVFRYDEASDRPRQFTQVGAELIGDGSLQADAEVVGLACQGLAHLGLSSLRLRVGHVGALSRLMAGFGLSERTRWFLVSRLGSLAAGDGAAVREEMTRLGLYGRSADLLPAGVSARDAHHVVDRLLAGMGGLLGSRDPEEVVTRYLARLEAADEPERVDAALAFLEELATVRGEPQRALAQLRKIVSQHRRYRLDPRPLDELRDLVALFSPERVAGAQVELDLALARGLAYYTGMVFDLYAGDSPRPAGGGGRYDGLVKALGGGEDTPALGFAYTLEAVEAALSAGPQKR